MYSPWVLSLPQYKIAHYCMMVVIILVAAGLEYTTYMKIRNTLIAFVLIMLQQYFPLSITNNNTQKVYIYIYI